jgi:hypothetical protein
MVAANQGDYPIVKLLLERESDVHAKDAMGRTALFHAALGGSVEVVKALLDKGARLDMDRNDTFSAFMAASQRGHDEVVELFLRQPYYHDAWNRPDDKGCTPMWLAARDGHEKAVNVFLERLGAKPGQLTRPMENAVESAIEVSEAWEYDIPSLKHVLVPEKTRIDDPRRRLRRRSLRPPIRHQRPPAERKPPRAPSAGQDEMKASSHRVSHTHMPVERLHTSSTSRIIRVTPRAPVQRGAWAGADDARGRRTGSSTSRCVVNVGCGSACAVELAPTHRPPPMRFSRGAAAMACQGQWRP